MFFKTYISDKAFNRTQAKELSITEGDKTEDLQEEKEREDTQNTECIKLGKKHLYG